MYERYEKLLKERNITNYRVHKDTGIAQTTLSDWKNGKITPGTDTLIKIALYFDVSIDWLLGQTDIRASYSSGATDNSSLFTANEERDIAQKLEDTLNELSTNEALMFDGEPLDDETKELLKSSIENSIRMGRTLAKHKFTP